MASPTPLGIHQIASGETYALVADLNRVGVTTDAAITFVKDRAEYLTDKAVTDAAAAAATAATAAAEAAAAPALAQAGAAMDAAGEAVVQSGAALTTATGAKSAIDVWDDKITQAEQDAASALALAVSTTAPTADAVNAVLLDEATSAGATFAQTVRRTEDPAIAGSFGVSASESTVIGPEAGGYAVWGGEDRFPHRIRNARLAHVSGYDNDIWDNAVAVQLHSYHSIAGGAASHATITGGSVHTNVGTYGFIGAGTGNRVLGRNGVVTGGENNAAGAVAGTKLTAPLAVGGTTITVEDATGVTVGQHVYLGSGTHLLGGPDGGLERARVASVSGATITLDQWQATTTTDAAGARTAPNGGATIARDTGSAAWFTNANGQPNTTVGGGANNRALGASSTVAGGAGCVASGAASTVAGGSEAKATGTGGFAAGRRVTASGVDSTVAGGLDSTASGNGAFTSGIKNTASGEWSVAHGSENVASQRGATVTGGWKNTADGMYGIISGGYDNRVTGGTGTTYGTITGGTGNRVTAGGGTVAGGSRNTVAALYGTASGRDNRVTAVEAVALGTRADARHIAGLTVSDGAFSVDGDAQTTVFTRRITSANDTTGTWAIIPAGMPAGWSGLWSAQIVCRNGNTAAKAWTARGCLRSTGTSLIQVGGAVTPTVLAEDTAMSPVTLATLNGASFVFRTTGLAGTTLRWVARIELTEVIA